MGFNFASNFAFKLYSMLGSISFMECLGKSWSNHACKILSALQKNKKSVSHYQFLPDSQQLTEFQACVGKLCNKSNFIFLPWIWFQTKTQKCLEQNRKQFQMLWRTIPLSNLIWNKCFGFFERRIESNFYILLAK